MSNPQPASPWPDAPTAKQLRYLRELATQRGTTFASPSTRAQASAEIRRLKAQPRQCRLERAVERRGQDRVDGPQDAARFRDGEIVGYGANAHWAHAWKGTS